MIQQQTGSTPFEIQAEWELYKTGLSDEASPLFVYLHGYGENIAGFKEKAGELCQLEGYHLFIQGPYPLPRPGMKNRGYAWYIYDGPESDFAAELARSTRLVESVVENVKETCRISEVIVIGFSMGAYLGGYWALFGEHSPEYLAACGGRIKTELLEAQSSSEKKPYRIAAFHGRDDGSVNGGLQEACIGDLQHHGYPAEMIWVNGGHDFSPEMSDAVKTWVINRRGEQSDVVG